MMKARRFTPAVLLALGLLVWTGLAWGTILEDEVTLNRVSQIVNLKGVSANGDISFTDLKRVMPDGSEVPFAIPDNRVPWWPGFTLTLNPLPPRRSSVCALRPSPFGSSGPTSSTATLPRKGTFSTGLTIGGPTTNYKIQSVYNGVIIPGALTVYMTGMLIHPKPFGPLDCPAAAQLRTGFSIESRGGRLLAF